MKQDIKNKISSMQHDKNTTFSIIASYILDHSNYKKLKIKDIIESCHVSSSGVIRFCKELGLSGFSELKYLLCMDADNRDYSYVKKMVLSQSADRHLNHVALAFLETRDLLSKTKLEHAITLIENADTIVAYGLGSSYILALDFEMKFSRIKKNVKAINDINLQYFASKNADSSTLAIAFSYSGKTTEVLDNLTEAKNQGAKTILITCQTPENMKYQFDEILYVYRSEPTESRLSTTSRLSMMYLVDLIYFSYFDKNYNKIEDILNKNTRY